MSLRCDSAVTLFNSKHRYGVGKAKNDPHLSHLSHLNADSQMVTSPPDEKVLTPGLTPLATLRA